LIVCNYAAGAESGAKPACKAANAGLFWPEDANSNGRIAVEYARRGQLEICTRNILFWAWKSPTVSLEELRKKSGRKHGDAGLPNKADSKPRGDPDRP